MAGFESRTLGRTGLKVGPLGVGCGYGGSEKAFEEAFERGCNYFCMDNRRKGAAMVRAIKNICQRGGRDELVIVLQSYVRSAGMMESRFQKGLRSLGLEAADVMILGARSRPPSARLMERALAMKERGLFRFLGLSGHNRSLFPRLAAGGDFDLFHVRYNAAHRGAEEEVFPHLGEGEDRPGLATYTATRWGALLKPRRMPPGQNPPPAADCYRFVLSQEAVDVCLTGPRNLAQMREALQALELGPLEAQEMERMRRIGDHVHARGRRFWERFLW